MRTTTPLTDEDLASLQVEYVKNRLTEMLENQQWIDDDLDAAEYLFYAERLIVEQESSDMTYLEILDDLRDSVNSPLTGITDDGEYGAMGFIEECLSIDPAFYYGANNLEGAG